MKLRGRFALITGASQGLGAAIADCYAAEGASLLLCARGMDALRATQARLARYAADGQQILVAQADIADREQVDALVRTARDSFPRIDILVNNAGVYGPFGNLDEVDWDEWVDALNINVLGTTYCCRAVIPMLKKQRYGKIINVSGGGATNPLPRISSYAVAKAAVVRLTETLAGELKDYHVDVNAVAPGILATRLTYQLLGAGAERIGAEFYGRIRKAANGGGTPLSVPAALCAYLGSAESDGITGKLLSAPWDPWAALQEHRADLDGTDIYTLRRILPKDRGKDWGDV